MTHSNEKKGHGLKGIGEKLNPTIYQVRFNFMSPGWRNSL
ncbi:hypothetical protein BAAL111456_28385 [Bacillus albus]